MRNNDEPRTDVPAGDPVIRELWAVKDAMAAEYGYDVKEMFRQLRTRHRALERDQGRLPPRHLSVSD